MHEYGYMGSACIPVAYDVARRRGLIKEGNLVVFMGSGVGYNHMRRRHACVSYCQLQS